jgi:feruloyl esterase
LNPLLYREVALQEVFMFKFFIPVMLCTATALAQTPCRDLNTVSLPDTTITSAELIPAGPYKSPANAPAFPPPPSVDLPGYCRIAAVLHPSPDSHIEMELWLPDKEWNGKFQGVGNGGFAGTISYSAMAEALREGYATASTDTGHKGANALFGIGHPEKVIDYAYRSVHEMTVKSKTLIGAFYGSRPNVSYWNGCSTGGRQGLMEAQRYPEDYDGIIAGAPANYHSHLHASDLAVAVPILKNPESNVPRAKLEMLNRAVLNSCDALDGVKDGILTNPRQCDFDPAFLLCRGGDSENCLTQPQLDAVKSVYAPTRFSTGEIIFPGKAKGSETTWMVFNTKQPSAVSMGTFQLTYQDADWDWRTFDRDRDTALADEKTGFINAIDPDLKAFEARGGKLLLYHGWSDFGIAPGNTINYYSSVLSAMGSGQDNWLRLFMVPGMGHCRGGDAPDQADYMSAMERWRESGIAPDRITAYHVTDNRVDITRPLCPYPQVAVYTGTGSTSNSENFSCRAPDPAK